MDKMFHQSVSSKKSNLKGTLMQRNIKICQYLCFYIKNNMPKVSHYCRFSYAGNWELVKSIGGAGGGQNSEEAMFVYIIMLKIGYYS